ncbi:PTS sugar transporter subunit IIA [Floccifex sp.]|uniref:PTS sugar transporter subunit IIA n=1 Tax=Floccifex sp. TaxID=2815810 RepID=UPI003F098CB8
MRRFIFASHHKLAYGLKDTVNFLTNSLKDIYDINAYLEDEQKDIDTTIAELFSSFDPGDEVIVLVDMMGGSVYQKFFPYMNDKVHVICGMNLPMAMSFVLASEEIELTQDSVQRLVMECRNQIVYVNQMRSQIDEDDE